MGLPADTTARVLEHRIRTETVRIVFAQSPAPIVISPLVAATMAWALWDVTEHARLTLWVALLAVFAAFRLTLLLLFRSRAQTQDLRGWDRAFIGLYLALSVVWGLGALWVMPGALGYEAIVFAFLMGMAGGAAVTYGIHKLSVLSLAFIMAPITFSFALRGDTVHYVMALAGVVYVAAIYRANRVLAHYFTESQQLALELAIARDKAEQLARIDTLTGLCNRRAFYEQGESLVRQALRYDKPLSLILLDIDHFKAVNDAHGHAAGDLVLQALARVLLETPRQTDVAARLGGEEFALVLPETALADATNLAERLRARLADKVRVPLNGGEIRFTASFGVAQCEERDTLDTVVARADAALYRAKEAGRDRVETARAPVAAPR